MRPAWIDVVELLYHTTRCASMDVEETAKAIKDMRIRGAGRIARACASALYEFADTYKGDDRETLMHDIEDAKETLIASRPTAVSLYNGVMASLKGIDKETDVDAILSTIKGRAEEFIDNSYEAVNSIAELGSSIIRDGDVIMTHCNSSAVISTLKRAHEQGKNIKVFATETRPWRQGLITSRELADAGIDVTLIVDSAACLMMDNVNKVFVGADTVTAQGTLVNKVGTSQLALTAHEKGIPFYACAETYKFSPLTLNGDDVRIEVRDIREIAKEGEVPDTVKIYNPVFDRTLGRYITYYITELGMISPSSARETIVELFNED